MALPKRKKWTEEEELALITKYSELSSDGTLSRLRTREKKFRPIADSVNSLHHSLDPSSYPFLWSWKDASTKVQNMRHQYLLVKHKLLSSSSSASAADCSVGVSIWPNFLHYRRVFGDHPLPNNPTIEEGGEGEELVDESENLGLELGFDEKEEEGNGLETPPPLPARRTSNKKKKKKKRRDLEEREWEERTERRREEWRRRVEGMLTQHRADMAEIQARVAAEQQAVISQLLGVVSHWAAGAGSGIGGADCRNQGTVGVIVPAESRGEDQQFIVDDG